ncbi:MAG: hypothetical protein ACI9CE_002362 [Flavobacterium sp.]|jgi:hypothetical protein
MELLTDLINLVQDYSIAPALLAICGLGGLGKVIVMDHRFYSTSLKTVFLA